MNVRLGPLEMGDISAQHRRGGYRVVAATNSLPAGGSITEA
jgi:hypothetical protein